MKFETPATGIEMSAAKPIKVTGGDTMDVTSAKAMTVSSSQNMDVSSGKKLSLSASNTLEESCKGSSIKMNGNIDLKATLIKEN